MARLDALPVELLCEIFQYVHDTCESSNDLFNISLLGRKYYPVARDTLYKAPRLLQPKNTDGGEWYYRRRHQLRTLLRTIISQPHLAKQICELQMTVKLRSFRWTPRTPDELCIVDFENEAVQSLPFVSADWIARMRSGEEAATCALILSLVPSLRRLYLNTVEMRHTIAKDGDLFVSHDLEIYMYDWFNSLPGEFNTRAIAGLRNLLSIRTEGRYPSCLLNIPTIEVIELGDSYHDLRFHELTSSNVSSLRLHANHYPNMALNAWQGWAYLTTKNIYSNLPCLYSLKTLHFIVTGSVGEITLRNTYPRQRLPIVAPNLRTFIYDTRAVFHPSEVYIPRPSPIETCFTNLLQGFADANSAPQLERVEMWPGLYQGDTETAFALPQTLRTWGDQFTMYTGDGNSLRRVQKEEDAMWPNRIMFLKNRVQ